jgi:phosphoenolpyruvate carboxykinase (ATP)
MYNKDIILQSISKSLASSNRVNGPSINVKFFNKTYSYNPHTNSSSDFANHIPTILYNLCPGELYKYALKEDNNTMIASTGAIVAYSGIKTGRSPKDKRVVYDKCTQDIWWDSNSPNIKMDETTFMINRETSICYLNNLHTIFIFDGYAGWDTQNRIKVRVICERAYHALFMNNMLIRPTKTELENFGDPDYTIYNAGKFPCNRFTGYMTSSTSIDLNFTRKEIIILGTQYAGEMKKAIFSVMHFLMPQKNILSLHSSANELDGNTTLFFGLSGTGKTTLSSDLNRNLIGDDEHCWTENGVFNIEGGCYAKCIGLTLEKEPDIWNSIKFGTLLENVIVDENYTVDYMDSSITQNTRAAFPIDYNKNAIIPCIGAHPKNIILLTCDAYGVLPPVSKLNNKQLMYYFISGYTSKIAGTEDGIIEPEATFSACFGEAFIVWHPIKYAKMLEEKIEKHKCTVWLINTGWLGGQYGVGSRCKLKYTREIINSIHNNTLSNVEYKTLPIFNIEYPTYCSNIDTNILNPKNLWEDKDHYDKLLRNLGERFINNFKKYDYKELEKYGPQL